MASLNRFGQVAVLCGIVLATVVTASGDDSLSAGHAIYTERCASCHGQSGEGVEGAAEEPLRGMRLLPDLTKVIAETMPEDDPELCVGEDAERVAAYIHATFYAKADRAAAIQLSHLTARQYRNTVADLIANFTGTSRFGDEPGLKVEWFDTRGLGKRLDSSVALSIDHDFGKQKAHPKVSKAEEFSARWTGSVLSERAGDYEFILKTENGARLWVNDRENALIDAWVSSKGRAKEHRATIRLLANRPYYFRLEFFKFKDPSASIRLMWKPPMKAEQVVPFRNLSTAGAQPLLVVTAPFPADDRVSGYERGVEVSEAWDQATTSAAMEAADHIARHVDRLARTKRNAKDRDKRVKQFLYDFTSLAFRRPLPETLRKELIDVHFDRAQDVETATKRVAMFVLKSPRFLYPELNSSRDQWDVASRLALYLWDSAPDQSLRNAVAKGQLKTRQQVLSQARRMLQDPRAKGKLQYFFDDWLPLTSSDVLPKDADRFPEFDEQMASDLRTSLELFIDDVVTSEAADYRRLLSSNTVFMNDRLAQFYEVELPEGDGFRKVELPQTYGVVTHPYTMSALAYHHLSSPIHRGVFVTRRLLGRTLKPPPQATEFKDAEFDPHMTTREKVAKLTGSTACQTCHVIINPLGFSLENYDAVGRYREREGERPIDVTADFPSISGEQVRLEGAKSLAQLIADSQHAQKHFVDQMFHQAVKQPINAYGDKVRDELADSFASHDYNIRELLAEIATLAAMHEISD